MASRISTTTTGPKTPIRMPKGEPKQVHQHFEWEMPIAPRIPGVPVSQDEKECLPILGGEYKGGGQAGVKKTGGDK